MNTGISNDNLNILQKQSPAEINALMSQAYESQKGELAGHLFFSISSTSKKLELTKDTNTASSIKEVAVFLNRIAIDDVDHPVLLEFYENVRRLNNKKGGNLVSSTSNWPWSEDVSNLFNQTLDKVENGLYQYVLDGKRLNYEKFYNKSTMLSKFTLEETITKTKSSYLSKLIDENDIDIDNIVDSFSNDLRRIFNPKFFSEKEGCVLVTGLFQDLLNEITYNVANKAISPEKATPFFLEKLKMKIKEKNHEILDFDRELFKYVVGNKVTYGYGVSALDITDTVKKMIKQYNDKSWKVDEVKTITRQILNDKMMLKMDNSLNQLENDITKVVACWFTLSSKSATIPSDGTTDKTAQTVFQDSNPVLLKKIINTCKIKTIKSAFLNFTENGMTLLSYLAMKGLDNEVDRVINMGGKIEDAIYGYGINNNTTMVEKYLKKAPEDKVTDYTRMAIKGFARGGYFTTLQWPDGYRKHKKEILIGLAEAGKKGEVTAMLDADISLFACAVEGYASGNQGEYLKKLITGTGFFPLAIYYAARSKNTYLVNDILQQWGIDRSYVVLPFQKIENENAIVRKKNSNAYSLLSEAAKGYAAGHHFAEAAQMLERGASVVSCVAELADIKRHGWPNIELHKVLYTHITNSEVKKQHLDMLELYAQADERLHIDFSIFKNTEKVLSCMNDKKLNYIEALSKIENNSILIVHDTISLSYLAQVLSNESPLESNDTDALNTQLLI